MLLFLVAAVLISALAAAYDYKTGLIPNFLTVGGIVGGLIGHTLYGWSVANWEVGLLEGAYALGGLLFCSLAPAVLYYKGGMGGGDLKLFAALGALCQPLYGIEVQMYSLLVAAIAAQAKLAYEGRLFQVLGQTLSLVFNPLRRPDKRRSLPQEAMTWFRMGPAIFVGALLTLVRHIYSVAPPSVAP